MLRPRRPIQNQTPGVALRDTLASRTVAKCNFEDANRLFVLPASQVLRAGRLRSCAAAVSSVIVLCVALGRQPPSRDTRAYCPARTELPEPVLQRLVYHLPHELESRLPAHRLGQRRHAKVGDGTALTASDTPEDQKA